MGMWLNWECKECVTIGQYTGEYEVILRIKNLGLEEAIRNLSCGNKQILFNVISHGVKRVDTEGICC